MTKVVSGCSLMMVAPNLSVLCFNALNGVPDMDPLLSRQRTRVFLAEVLWVTDYLPLDISL